MISHHCSPPGNEEIVIGLAHPHIQMTYTENSTDSRVSGTSKSNFVTSKENSLTSQLKTVTSLLDFVLSQLGSDFTARL